jgi:DNA sulfur modification protein DndE
MFIESFKLSQQAKDQLIRIKRNTGIEHWNVLCRWGFCLSLREPTPPAIQKIPSDSNLEMTWKVFGGDYQLVYEALLKERCLQDGLAIDDEALALQFKLHLHRGISYLFGIKELRRIINLLEMVK